MSITPFGRPVVPEVYINRWMSSPPTSRPRRDRRRRSRSVKGSHPSVAVRATRRRGREPIARPAIASSARSISASSHTSTFACGVFQQVPQLGCGETPVDRHGDRTEVVGGEDRGQELGAVVRQQRRRRRRIRRPVRGSPPASRRRPLGHLPVGHGPPSKTANALSGVRGRVVLEHAQPAHVGRRRGRGGHARRDYSFDWSEQEYARRMALRGPTGTQTGGQTRQTSHHAAPSGTGGATRSSTRRRRSSPSAGYHATSTTELCEAQRARQGCALLLHRLEGASCSPPSTTA